MANGAMMPPTVPNLGPLQRGSTNLAVLALLAGLAVALNALPLPLFFGIHLLLGSVPAMLALLLWRTWAATAIALLAALQTWSLWGHPWAILIFTAELVWLTLALRRGPADGSKGEIIYGTSASGCCWAPPWCCSSTPGCCRSMPPMCWWWR